MRRIEIFHRWPEGNNPDFADLFNCTDRLGTFHYGKLGGPSLSRLGPVSLEAALLTKFGADQIDSRKYIVGTSMTPAFVITSLRFEDVANSLAFFVSAASKNDDDFVFVVSGTK